MAASELGRSLDDLAIQLGAQHDVRRVRSSILSTVVLGWNVKESEVQSQKPVTRSGYFVTYTAWNPFIFSEELIEIFKHEENKRNARIMEGMKK